MISLYNCERLIEKTLCSVLSKTCSEYELILVDDGSTDNTADIIVEYRQNDNRINIYSVRYSSLLALF